MSRRSDSGGVPGTIRARRMAAAVVITLLVLPPFAACAADVRVFTAADGLPSNRVTALAAAPEGKLWVGTGNAGVYLLDPATGRGKGYRAADGVSSDEVTSIALFRGKVYVGTAAGLSVLDGSKWKSIPRIENVTMRNVRLAASPDGKELWVCSMSLAGGTLVYDGKAWTFVGGAGKGLFSNITAFGFSPGVVLLGAVSGVVYERKGKVIEALGGRFPAANVTSVAARGGSVYAGTNLGLFLWRGKEWEPVSVPGEFAGQAVFSVLRSDVDLFVAGVRGLLLLDRTGETRVLSGTAAFPAGPVYALAEDGGTLYAATDLGVAALRGWRE